MNPATILAALVLGAGLVVPGAAGAASHPRFGADAAMRKGIRDYARHGLEPDRATASRIRVSCRPVKKVGDKGPCKGTFRLTLDGRSADYTLTGKARTLRIAPHAIEYRVAATTDDEVPGLPASTGSFSGFLQ
jgi:hypothetical protein